LRTPIDTATNIGKAVMSPVKTAKAIACQYSEKWESGTRGKGEIIGEALLGIATGGATKAVAESGTVAKIIDKVADVSEAAGKAANMARRMAGGGNANSAAKIMDVSNPGSFTLRELGEGIASSPGATRAYGALQREGFDLNIVNRADNMAGETLNTGAVNINRFYNGSVGDALSTLVHESKHVDLFSNTGNLYGLRGMRKGEYAARAREFFFDNGRRPNASERGGIKDKIRKDGYK
jgi:hypothetical protein